MFISSIVVCCFINWQLTLISVTMGPISAWTLGLMGKVGEQEERTTEWQRGMKRVQVASRYAIHMQERTTESAIVVEEAIMNVKTVAACNAQEHMVQKYEETLDTIVPPAVKYNFWVGFFEGLAFVQIYGIMGVTFW